MIQEGSKADAGFAPVHNIDANTNLIRVEYGEGASEDDVDEVSGLVDEDIPEKVSNKLWVRIRTCVFASGEFQDKEVVNKVIS